MAGHSKWKNIRIRKGKQDALRGKLFTRLSREIIVAARAGGGDPGTNSQLRVALEKAKMNSLPAENIKRAIQRGVGEIEGVSYEEAVFEGYGPGGAAVIVEVLTENRQRTVADVRHAFSKHGGNLSENGSVSWQFKHLGQISFKKDGLSEGDVTLAAIEAGAQDIASDDESYSVFTEIEDLHTTNDALEKLGYKAEDVSLVRIPLNMAEPNDEDMRKLVKMIFALDDLDDVKETYVNVNIPESFLE